MPGEGGGAPQGVRQMAPHGVSQVLSSRQWVPSGQPEQEPSGEQDIARDRQTAVPLVVGLQ